MEEIPVRKAAMDATQHLEDSVAAALNSMGYSAETVGDDPSQADVRVLAPERFMVEVKMASAQFGSAKIGFDGRSWVVSKGSANDPFMCSIVRQMNSRQEFRDWISELRTSVCRQRGVDLPHIRLVRNNTGKIYKSLNILDPIVKPHELLAFCKEKGRQDIISEIRDAAPLIRMHYLHGKKEVAHFLQWDDNLYTFTAEHPFKGRVVGGGTIPLFENVKTKFRISVVFASDKRYYFIMPRITPMSIVKSPYSILSPMKPKSKKIFPFPPTEYAHEHLKKRIMNFEFMLAEAARAFGASE